MTEKEFKDIIWKKEQKEYLKNKCNYYPDEKYFKSKTTNSGTSDDYYIDTKALKEWAYEISKCYTPYGDDHALLIKDLLEQRKGQYSNGTLYSSSRLIAEMFKAKENREKLLKQLGLEKYQSEEFKWYLEYRLPIFESIESHPAQIDLAAVNATEKILICCESKMKEIYSNHHNDFSEAYKEKLVDLNKNNEFKFEKGTRDKPYRLVLNGKEKLEYCNFYYKQQICHLLGMKKFLYDQREKDCQCFFLNFAFDISDIPEYKNEEHIKAYQENETAIMEMLKPLFEEKGIKYCGLKTQKDFN